MVGIKYAKYFPKEVYSLPSGLTIYRSVFETPGGRRGVVVSPHPEFTKYTLVIAPLFKKRHITKIDMK